MPCKKTVMISNAKCTDCLSINISMLNYMSYSIPSMTTPLRNHT